MSNIPGNPHVQHERNRNVHTNEGLIEATLALAFEQRTANLIAIYSMTSENTEALTSQAAMSPEDWEALAKQIVARTTEGN